MTFDPIAFKAQFPLFDNLENKSLSYLDNAATTQKPLAVIDAVSEFYCSSNANAHRGSHRLGRRATSVVESARQLTSRFLGAKENEIVFTRGATEALNLLAFSLTESLQAGDEIILSEAEHHANLISWQMAAQRKKLILRFIPLVNHVVDGWQLDVEKLPELLSSKTKIVALTAASNVLGKVTDLAFVKQHLENLPSDSRPIWVVDAAQLAAHKPIDVVAIGCDFLVLAGHKMFGPSGIGVLFGKAACLSDLPPWQGGGEMVSSVSLNESAYVAPPHCFEPGTSSLADIAGWQACLQFWQDQSRRSMAEYEQALLEYGYKKLEQIPGLCIVNSRLNNLGIIALAATSNNVDKSVSRRALSLGDLADWLDQHDIAVRVGHHCAQPLLQRIGELELLRISLAAYNTPKDIDCLANALVSAVEQLQGTERGLQTAKLNANVDDVFCDTEEIQALDYSQLLACKGWQPRYKRLLQWGDLLSEKPALRQEKFRVQACESGAWLASRFDNGQLKLALDSDSRLVKGLAVLLMVLMVNKTREELQQLAIDEVFTQLQFEKYLSPSRSNGFWALLQAIEQQIFANSH